MSSVPKQSPQGINNNNMIHIRLALTPTDQNGLQTELVHWENVSLPVQPCFTNNENDLSLKS